MHSDVYLLLYRMTGSYQQIEANKATAAVVLKTLTKGMIIGDSLDAPFMGFIKVNNISHEVSFGDTQEKLKWSEGYRPDFSKLDERKGALTTANRDFGDSYYRDDMSFDEVVATYRSTIKPMQAARAQRIDTAYHEAVENKRNAFISSRLPTHGDLTFKKNIDRATPQLAFGCSMQEKFPVALFFFRKKIGLGLGGIRIPYLTIGLRKCRISKWEIDGDEETVSLRYGDIAWAALGQIANSNFPFPVPSARIFDTETGKGGETYSKFWAYGVQAIGAAMSLIAGAVTAGIKAGRGDGSYG